MINVSNRFKEVARCSGREWHYKATLELANGEVMELDDHDFLEHGVRYTSCTSNPGEFNMGGIIADDLRIILNNYEGRFTHVDVDGSVLTLYIGLVVEQHWEHGKTLEWICIGRFYPEKADMRQCQILLEAYDGTYQFDKPYSESKQPYPATLGEIMENCCNDCGIVLKDRVFTNSDYVVHKKPDDDRLSYRDVVVHASQLAGCIARFDNVGRLEMKWYDTEHPVATIENVESVWTTDITITGINFTTQAEEKKTYSFGTDKYVFNMDRDILLQENAEEACATLANKLIGFTFRPFTHNGPSQPHLEAGDAVLLRDRHGNEYRSVITEINYSSGDVETFQACSRSPKERRDTKRSQVDIAVSSAKKETDKKINAYDAYSKAFATMASATVGYYTTQVPQDDGSVLTYAHNKPILEESETQWKLTGNVLAVSNDYGKTWRGIDKDGNALLESLAAKTIVADKVKTGRLEGYDGRSYWDFDTGKLRLSGEFFQYADDGSPATALTNNSLEIYSWEDKGNFVGEIGSRVGENSKRQIMAVNADHGDILTLGVIKSDNTGASNRYISITDVPDEYAPGFINFHNDVTVSGNIDMFGHKITNCDSLIPFGRVTSFDLQKGGANGVYLEIGNIDQYFGVDVWQSDARLKKSIKPSKVNALEEIKKIPHRSFKMKENDAVTECGYIAQELQELNPAYVLGVDQTDADGNVTDTVYQIREQAIIPLLTKAIQELAEQNESLQRQVDALRQGAELTETMQQKQVQAVPEKINKLAKMKIKHPKTVKKEPKTIKAD